MPEILAEPTGNLSDNTINKNNNLNYITVK